MTKTSGVALGLTVDQPLLVDAPSRHEPQESRQFISQSVHIAAAPAQFNTLKQDVVKRLRVCGATLKWDHNDDNYGLMSLQGTDTLDLAELEMHADIVQILSPLRFPGTHVTIYARELIFGAEGSIDTSPLPYSGQAVSSNKTKDGIPADAAGKPTYRAADGLDGEPAGSIDLYVKAINVPAGAVMPDGTAVKRFIAHGSDGQQSETGGLKPYVAGTGNPSVKSLTPLKESNMASTFSMYQWDHRQPIADWRWPGDTAGPSAMPLQDDALNKGSVVHWTVIAHDDYWLIPDLTVWCLASATTEDAEPGYGSKTFDGPDDKGALTWMSPGRQRPGNGEDAYPSGLPGRGGDGGKVTSYLADSGLATQICDVQSGRGLTGETVKGGEPGGPSPAYWLKHTIVYRAMVASSRKPAIVEMVDVSAKPGAQEVGRTHGNGNPGAVTIGTQQGFAWVSRYALDALIAFAQSAYRNGDRDAAIKAIQPYVDVCNDLRASAWASAPVLAQLHELVAMRANMDHNLDYFGCPPGWLPRLNVTSSYQLWNNQRQYASKLLYYATQAEKDYDKLGDLHETLNDTSAALDDEVTAAVDALPAAYAGLEAAQLQLEQVKQKLTAEQDTLQVLRDKATNEAKDKIWEHQLWSGVATVLGGVLKVIPYGQPVLGAVGGTVADLAKIDPNSANPWDSVGDALGQVGGHVKTFLDKNHDLLVKQNSQDLRDKLKGAKNSIDTLEREVRLKQEPLRQELDAKQALIDNDKADLAQKTAELAKLTKDLDDLKKKPAATDPVEVTKRKKEIDDQTLGIAGVEASKRQLEQQIKANTTDLAIRRASLDDDVKGFEKDLATRDEASNTLLTSLAGVGDGISTVGDGIKAWAATPDQKEIDRLTEDILKSEFKDDYNTLLQGVESLNAEKVHAVSAVASSMQQINDCTTSISRNLMALTALSDQRQSLEQALDAGVRQYLGSMQQRARDRLLWYQYNFAQAYKYETLLPPGDDFLNLDDWIERLQKAKRGKDWTPGSDVVLSKDDFQAAEEAVVKDQLLELAKSIVAQRQKYAALTTNDFDCALTSDQCEMLRTQGRVTFNLIRDFQKGSFHDVQAKIVDLTLEGFTLASTDPTLSLDVEFRHSGESVILDHSDTYYSFRCALDDDPIGWGYVYNQSKVTHPVNGAEPFSKDHRLDPEIDQVLADTKIAYQEYFPSFFSDITLWLNRGDHTEQAKLKAQLGKITAISEVRFSVKVARSR